MPQILVVDDDLGTRQTFSVILRLEGWDVVAAATGRDALVLATDCRADVALLDVRLPDMTGVEVLRAFSTHSPATRCVMMTAFGSVSSAVEAMKLGACDYVEKPLTDLQLVELVHHVESETRSVASSTVSNDRSHSIDWRVVMMLELIQQRFRESDLRMSEIAGLLSVSTEHLCRLLKRDTGEGFLLHLHRARIEEAKRLLQSTSLSVKEIAFNIGYHSTTRMDRYFNRFCGLSPVVFRQKTRGVHATEPLTPKS
jgi:YesN/AraC family two-component response regulator